METEKAISKLSDLVVVFLVEVNQHLGRLLDGCLDPGLPHAVLKRILQAGVAVGDADIVFRYFDLALPHLVLLH